MITPIVNSRLPQAAPSPAPLKNPAQPATAFSLQLAPPAPLPKPAAAQPASPAPLKQLAGDLDRQRRSIDQLLAQAQAGRTFSPAELIVLQARVYTYSQNIEVISSLVDKTVSAVKTTLNTQL